MSIRKIIDWAIQDAKDTQGGTVNSPFYRFYDLYGNWTWACDVRLSTGETLKAVPVAFSNRDISYSEQGRGVGLSRLGRAKWQVSDLSKTITDTTHILYLSFSDDLYTVNRDELRGEIIRPLTYGELGSLVEPQGYGTLPYGAQGKFNADGALVEIVESD